MRVSSRDRESGFARLLTLDSRHRQGSCPRLLTLALTTHYLHPGGEGAASSIARNPRLITRWIQTPASHPFLGTLAWMVVWWVALSLCSTSSRCSSLKAV